MSRGLMKVFFWIAIVLVMQGVLILLPSSDAFAATWYINKEAKGANNGTSWTDAWNEMSRVNSSSTSPGDTVYIAGGTYTTPLSISKSGNADTSQGRIVYKRATVAEHGSDTGWSDAYDRLVIIDTNSSYNINISGSYITLDGVTRWGIESRGATGFQISMGGKYVTIRYIKFDGSSNTCEDSMYTVGSHAIIEYCWFLNFDEDPQGLHRDSISISGSSYVTFRYNRIENGGQWISTCSPGEVLPYFYIYGNVFFNSRNAGAYNGIVPSNCAPTNWYIYNNTFDCTYSRWKMLFNWAAGGGNQATFKNNAVRICDAAGVSGTHNNNAYETTCTSVPAETGRVYNANLGFTNYSAHDYSLQAGSPLIGSGVNLGAPYNYDYNGNMRPESGAWDIGAYQYSTSPGPSGPPSPPANLRILP